MAVVVTVPCAKADEAVIWDFAVLPRLPETDSAAMRINRALTGADAAASVLRDDCLGEPGSDFGRDVEVAFDGPAFLSVVEYIGYWCDGMPHPWSGMEPMTFDRSTGLRVAWDDLLGTVEGDAPDERATILTDRLHGAFMAGVAPVPQECVALLEDERLPFRLWLDARRGAVAVMPVGLAYVNTFCVDIAYLSVAELSDLGADPKLIEALAAPRP